MVSFASSKLSGIYILDILTNQSRMMTLSDKIEPLNSLLLEACEDHGRAVINLAVDKAMVGFTGRDVNIVATPSKPTLTGIKILTIPNLLIPIITT